MSKTNDGDAALAESEASYLDDLAERLRARAKELRERPVATWQPHSGPVDLETKLEALPWKQATSGKCDYAREVPAELVTAVRSTKGGVKGNEHHFTASATEPTLFRYKRGAK